MKIFCLGSFTDFFVLARNTVTRRSSVSCHSEKIHHSNRLSLINRGGVARLLLLRGRLGGRCRPAAGLGVAGLVSIHRRAAAGGRGVPHGRPTVRIVATAASIAALVPIVRFATSPSLQAKNKSCCAETMRR